MACNSRYSKVKTFLIPFLCVCFSNTFVGIFIYREYLPPNIVKFNAFAIHGENWGEGVLDDYNENKRFEALYPVDTESSGLSSPDFHFLEAFQPINLSEIGYEEQQNYSPLWETALSDGDNSFT